MTIEVGRFKEFLERSTDAQQIKRLRHESPAEMFERHFCYFLQ